MTTNDITKALLKVALSTNNPTDILCKLKLNSKPHLMGFCFCIHENVVLSKI